MTEKSERGFTIDISSPIKLLGLVLNFHYLYTHPPVKFNPMGILYYCLLVWIGYLLSGLIKRSPGNFADPGTIVLRGRNHFKGKPWKRLWQHLLPAGEDGIFLLPLLYLGVNIWSAAVASILFSLSHYLNYKEHGESRRLYGIAVSYFFVILYILPMGILTVMVGHVIFDALNSCYWSYKYKHIKST